MPRTMSMKPNERSMPAKNAPITTATVKTHDAGDAG
jgi:hypothetical protein